MSWARPSLVRRLTLGFILGHILALLIFMVALLPATRMDDVDQLGPEVALSMLQGDLVAVAGAPTLRADAEFTRFARSSPQAWFIARSGERETRWGAVPSAAPALLRALSPVVKTAEFGGVGSAGRAGDASYARVDTEAGPMLVAAGGISPETLTMGVWLGHLHREGFTLVPLASALLSVLGALLAIPLILRSVRPTVLAAAAIDPADLRNRLPEARVVKELLPLVRAFNAALDRLEEAFERRRRFIADVAHELRTPIAVLNMHVEELPEGGKKPDLQRTIFRLGHMVGQMLDAERLASARRGRDPVDLVDLGRAAVAEVAPLAVANGYEIGFSSAEERVLVSGDGYAISRAMANLLGNAIAHGGGAGAIELKVHRDGRVDVTDDGPGVPADARDRIFEPFRRERWDRDGCGLGLHLVREIMHAHGGEVSLVGSDPGSIFRLDFAPARVAA